MLALVVGYLMKYVTDWMQDRRSTRHARESRAAARRADLIDRRNQFQLDTLLNLQEAILRLIRCGGAAHHLDVMSHRKSGQWHKELYPEQLDEQSHVSQVDTTKLMVRVRDREIRSGVERLKAFVSNIPISRSPDEGQRAVNAMELEFEVVNARIGEVLRKLDDDMEEASHPK